MGWWDYAALALLSALFTFGIYAVMRVTTARKELDISTIRVIERVKAVDEHLLRIEEELKRIRDRIEKVEQRLYSLLGKSSI